MLRNTVFVAVLALIGVSAGLLAYYGLGHADAIDDSPHLIRLADRLIARDQSGDGLGPDRQAMLLGVVDPGFAAHQGADMDTPGGGMTSITYALAKRLDFDGFHPGVAWIRHRAYARGLEERLSKRQILALWLETVEMGRARDGWMKGFFMASRVIYDRPPAKLTDRQFLRLVAVVIAPTRFTLDAPDPALDERVARIERLLAGTCARTAGSDVWLQGCAST
ncbi:hypothetical protein HNO88_000204 [Novosphingobium chloroacetimidivorans]|uniref:Glycosyl transferase family 51 domain-containing protein n=1 Tax=Novosphingobium chloroacetimidivorans TaxID=1428314 RepID=A0A7W7K5Z9_9SPHN|nr:transglycosylase domain-containing protein [Novosphingobium chloroacetimidivorans]MBB4856907.1 hypothetical protein [Novosphingobium chloroacetimidivorans]